VVSNVVSNVSYHERTESTIECSNLVSNVTHHQEKTESSSTVSQEMDVSFQDSTESSPILSRDAQIMDDSSEKEEKVTETFKEKVCLIYYIPLHVVMKFIVLIESIE
jgi:hypothetical protein